MLLTLRQGSCSGGQLSTMPTSCPMSWTRSSPEAISMDRRWVNYACAAQAAQERCQQNHSDCVVKMTTHAMCAKRAETGALAGIWGQAG